MKDGASGGIDTPAGNPTPVDDESKLATAAPAGLVRTRSASGSRTFHFNQEKIVFAITIVLFASFCLTLDQFATPGNLISLLQSVAILGVLGVGMALVVIGRGIDLTMVTMMGDFGRLGVQ